MLALLLAALAPTTPIIPFAVDNAVLTVEQQWKILESCPRVSVTKLTGKVEFGTAVCYAMINDTAYFLTAEHVVTGNTKIQLEFFTRESHPKVSRVLEGAFVSLSQSEGDFAVLSVVVGQTPVPQLQLASDRPKKYPFPAVSVGYDRSLPTCRAETVISKKLVRGGINAAFYWELEKPSERGRSGGPLLDAQGRIIGINSANQAGRGYSAHLDEIVAGLITKKQTAGLNLKK